MPARKWPESAPSGHPVRPNRPARLCFGEPREEDDDDDWESGDPNPTGDATWEPDPLDDEDLDEPDPQPGDFWFDVDDDRDA